MCQPDTHTQEFMSFCPLCPLCPFGPFLLFFLNFSLSLSTPKLRLLMTSVSVKILQFNPLSMSHLLGRSRSLHLLFVEFCFKILERFAIWKVLSFYCHRRIKVRVVSSNTHYESFFISIGWKAVAFIFFTSPLTSYEF